MNNQIAKQMMLNKKEREVVLIMSIVDLISSMVNNANLIVCGQRDDATVRFNDSSEYKLFYVLFVDLLSRPSKSFFGKEYSNSLELLQSLVLKEPSFGDNKTLLESLSEMLAWLDVKYTFEKRWFPSVGREIDVTLNRKDMIKICGNITKHNFTRLDEGVAKLIKRNIPDLKQNEEFVIVSEFYEHFHTDVLNYHSTILVEFVNNLRWALQDYMEVELGRSYNYQNQRISPDGISDILADHCYWELMWMLQRRPYVPQFKTTHILKKRY